MALEPIPEVVKKYDNLAIVCVPKTWIDKQIIDFTEKEFPSKTIYGWSISVKENSSNKIQCSKRPDFFHVFLNT